MPELPDLEVLKDALAGAVTDRTIAQVRSYRPGILRTFDPTLDMLAGRGFAAIQRRGKHLILTVAPDLHLVLHLMTSGRLVLTRADSRITKATGLAVRFEDGEDLRLVENGRIKRAAAYVVHAPIDVPRIASAGIEPLSDEFTPEAFAALARDRRRQAKKLLTDQTVIAGIGTAYADEILFEARVSPIRYASTMSEEDVLRLYASIRRVLGEAIAAITTIHAHAVDRVLPDKERGHMRVYKRGGTPCPACGTRIAEIRYAQTRTYYCPTCQAGGRALPDRRAWLER